MIPAAAKNGCAQRAQEELLNRLLSNEKAGALLRGLGVFVIDYSAEVAVPNTFWRELGYGAEEMLDGTWKAAVHPEDRVLIENSDYMLQSGNTDAWNGEFRIVSKSGEYYKIRHKAVVIERNRDGTPTLLVGWDMDITEYAQEIERAKADSVAQERRFLRSETIRTAGAILSSELDPVRAAERVLAQASRVVPFDSASVWTLDGEQLIRLAARGLDQEESIHREAISDVALRILLDLKTPRTTILPNDPQPARLEVPLLVRGRVQGLIEFRSSNADAYGTEETGSAVQFADHAVVALANALRYHATEIEAATDWLTGLQTRRAFMKRADRLNDELPENSQLSALMIDIDRFKQVNDSYGHKTGDEALAAVANTCRETLRSQDLCCRYGGEEIVVILPQTDRDTAYLVGERLRAKVENIRHPTHPDLRITISIGICTKRAGGDFRELIAEADEALYMAKASGRNRCEMKAAVENGAGVVES